MRAVHVSVLFVTLLIGTLAGCSSEKPNPNVSIPVDVSSTASTESLGKNTDSVALVGEQVETKKSKPAPKPIPYYVGTPLVLASDTEVSGKPALKQGTIVRLAKIKEDEKTAEVIYLGERFDVALADVLPIRRYAKEFGSLVAWEYPSKTSGETMDVQSSKPIELEPWHASYLKEVSRIQKLLISMTQEFTCAVGLPTPYFVHESNQPYYEQLEPTCVSSIPFDRPEGFRSAASFIYWTVVLDFATSYGGEKSLSLFKIKKTFSEKVREQLLAKKEQLKDSKSLDGLVIKYFLSPESYPSESEIASAIQSDPFNWQSAFCLIRQMNIVGKQEPSELLATVIDANPECVAQSEFWRSLFDLKLGSLRKKPDGLCLVVVNDFLQFKNDQVHPASGAVAKLQSNLHLAISCDRNTESLEDAVLLESSKTHPYPSIVRQRARIYEGEDRLTRFKRASERFPYDLNILTHHAVASKTESDEKWKEFTELYNGAFAMQLFGFNLNTDEAYSNDIRLEVLFIKAIVDGLSRKQWLTMLKRSFIQAPAFSKREFAALLMLDMKEKDATLDQQDIEQLFSLIGVRCNTSSELPLSNAWYAYQAAEAHFRVYLLSEYFSLEVCRLSGANQWTKVDDNSITSIFGDGPSKSIFVKVHESSRISRSEFDSAMERRVREFEQTSKKAGIRGAWFSKPRLDGIIQVLNDAAFASGGSEFSTSPWALFNPADSDWKEVIELASKNSDDSKTKQLLLTFALTGGEEWIKCLVDELREAKPDSALEMTLRHCIAHSDKSSMGKETMESLKESGAKSNQLFSNTCFARNFSSYAYGEALGAGSEIRKQIRKEFVDAVLNVRMPVVLDLEYLKIKDDFRPAAMAEKKAHNARVMRALGERKEKIAEADALFREDWKQFRDESLFYGTYFARILDTGKFPAIDFLPAAYGEIEDPTYFKW